MLKYNNHYNRLTALDLHKSAMYGHINFRLSFECALRPDSCIPLLMDLYNGKQPAFDINYFTVVDPALRELAIYLFTCQGICKGQQPTTKVVSLHLTDVDA